MAAIPQSRNIPGIKKIIGVISGKGGAGKTFVAINLALSLSKLGAKVGLLDADIYCPDVFKMLGLAIKIHPTSDNKILPAEKWGIKAMSMAGLCSSEDEPVFWRAPITSKIITQLLKETLWGELDFLIIDFPSGTGDIISTIMQNFHINAAIVVTAPQNLSTVNARKAANMAMEFKIPLLGVIENMRGEAFGEGGGIHTAEKLYTTFLGSIPMKKQICALCDQGIPAISQIEEIDMIFSKISRLILQRISIAA